MINSSKESSETLVIEADLDLCNKIRNELQSKFDFIWLIVYTKSPKTTSAYITVSNAFGGQLEKKKADQVIIYAKEFHDKLKY